MIEMMENVAVGTDSLICSPKMRIEKRKSVAASVSSLSSTPLVLQPEAKSANNLNKD